MKILLFSCSLFLSLAACAADPVKKSDSPAKDSEKATEAKGSAVKATTDPNAGLSKELKKLQAGFAMPSDAELKKSLTDIQYQVTRHEGTERPFTNEYWENKEEGIYVDRISGIPLFTSITKYKSGTGWPSFYAPIHDGEIVLKEDRKLFSVRVEVRSKTSDSHLGHVFNDGPKPTGKRYCMNSAALRFVAKEDLKKEGLGAYLHLFEKKK